MNGPLNLIDKVQELDDLNEQSKANQQPLEGENQSNMTSHGDYTPEFKEEAVRSLIEGHRTYSIWAETLGISVKLLKQWRGELGHKYTSAPKFRQKKAKGKRTGHRTHSLEFKRKAVKMVVVDGLKYTDVGDKLDLHPNQISMWRKRHNFKFNQQDTETTNNAPVVAAPKEPGVLPFTQLPQKYITKFEVIQKQIDSVTEQNTELEAENARLKGDYETLNTENERIKREHNILKQAVAIYANDVT